MSQMALTETEQWDAYWSSIDLPSVVDPARGLQREAILAVFREAVSGWSGRSCVEVGGAPGQYLAYLHRELGLEVTCLDYSPVGCEATRENFRLLGIEGNVICADFLAPDAELPTFDVVYSLGFVEHFEDLTGVVERHLALLRPGGRLILGVPNFLGVNGWFMRRLAPELLAGHHLPSMELSRWDEFAEPLGLRTLFREYVGGFEAGTFRQREGEGVGRKALYAVASGLDVALRRRPRWLRRFNAPWLSGYAMGVFERV